MIVMMEIAMDMLHILFTPNRFDISSTSFCLYYTMGIRKRQGIGLFEKIEIMVDILLTFLFCCDRMWENTKEEAQMKKTIFIILLCTLLLTGCGDPQPSDVSDSMYENAVYALNVVDKFLDGDATRDETYQKLDDMNIVVDDNYEKDSSIEISLLSLRIDIFGLKVGTTDLSNLKEDRDSLADKINYK